MRDLIRQILQGYQSLNLEGQDEGYVQFSGQEPDTQQAVSIKILPRILGRDPEIASRFSDLARVIRQLNHPNIASIRKIGEESGLPYVVTRAIEKGHPLATELNQPWAVDAAADVVEQVGAALDHAYRKGLVHGTLTPENVMIQDDGRVMVTDFGLSELTELVGGSAKQAVSPYLAPERVSGQSADASADVYSLAAILYGMLTKQQPQVVDGQVLPPSRFNPDLPEAMDAVLVKALAPSPADRYPDVKTFLAAVAASRVVPAEKPSSPVTSDVRCPNCGADKQTGRFCRKCGQRLRRPRVVAQAEPSVPKSKLDEPIQVTKVEVGHIEIGKGIEMSETTIAHAMTVASSDLEVDFPEPIKMPELDTENLWPSLGDRPMIAMPEPPEMPLIDWAEIAPPMPQVPEIEEIPLAEEGD